MSWYSAEANWIFILIVLLLPSLIGWASSIFDEVVDYIMENVFR